MKWWRFIRRFGAISPCTDEKCEGIDGAFPIMLTELYSKLLTRYHTGAMSSVAINCGLTVPEIGYDLTNQRLTEFSKYVYGDISDGLIKYAGSIPPSFRCWRDLIITMAVLCNDEVCGSCIISMPEETRAYVTEMAERMNTNSVLDRMDIMDAHYKGEYDSDCSISSSDNNSCCGSSEDSGEEDMVEKNMEEEEEDENEEDENKEDENDEKEKEEDEDEEDEDEEDEKEQEENDNCEKDDDCEEDEEDEEDGPLCSSVVKDVDED